MGLTFPGGMQMNLLWQNSNPESSFPAQNIELDLSPYKAVLVRYRDTTNTQKPEMLENGIYFVDNTRSLMVQVGEQSRNNFVRAVRFDAEAAHFGECIGPQGNALNTVAVPFQIYGIQF